MPLTTNHDLYARGAATLLASWEAYAHGSAGARLERVDGVSAAVFPHGPERSVFNNALLDRDLPSGERTAAVDAMHEAYTTAGVERYAAWVHESDQGMRSELVGRGYTVAESTRAMGMPLDTAGRLPDVELGPSSWADHLRYLQLVGAPAGLLEGADPHAFHVVTAMLDGESVATAIAFDHDGDRGVFNVGTIEAARRQGLASALTAQLIHDAAERGCTTASLQSTPMAERVYASVGFRDLGRILEYAPKTLEPNRVTHSQHHRPDTLDEGYDP